MFGDLEKTCGEIRWRFGENCSAILEKTVRRFGENLFGDFWRKRVGNLEKSFGDIVGDLEKHGRRSYGYFVLEFIIE